MNSYALIALFVCNGLQRTKKVIEAIKKNYEDYLDINANH